ncbi:tripartite tricarboxylate transporter TctB family protein [Virgibacillus ndiopensis]|uniref:tripartite tricarboxylate transporter TctB family protein n=1 Tax=Virgibacillus ndiopensis TaxID=2004408 RepID=UPI000C077D9D|nr:tripartite tricarboxylate transporter TctB family protein [Virgibacillus ndiopensis]
MDERMRDRYSGFVLLFISLLSWFVIIPYGIESSEGMTTVGPSFFPKFITIALIILSAFLVIKSFFKIGDSENNLEKDEGTEETSEPRGKVSVGVWVFIVMIGYIYLADIIGYLCSTVISMSVVMWLLKARKWYLYLILIATIFALQYVFENIMYIRLP